MKIGYVRVSTKGQQRDGNSIDEQTAAILERYPDAEIVTEACSGAKERPKFDRVVETLCAGDLLVVTKLDRFCRATKEGLSYIDKLLAKGVSIHILNMGLIENTPMGRLIVTNLLAFAEFERAMILERTSTGKAVAKQKNPDFKEGRPRVDVDGDAFRVLRQKQTAGEITATAAARELGISRSAWYNLCREVQV